MKNTYYIGIDGGGTKTNFILFDSDKNSIASVLMPTIHPAQTSFKEAVSILTEAREKLLINIKDCDYDLKVGAGLGGYGINKDYRKKLEDEFSSVFEEFRLYSDAYAAMLGALGGDDGILIIAGTGSIGLAKIGENTYRCGKAIISAALKESDGRNKKSKIYDLVLEYFKMNSVNDIATSDFTREHIAGLAAEASKYIYSCESIKIIFERAAGEITLHIKALSEKFENKIKLSYIGGVFKSEFIMKMIKEMNPDIDIVSPIFPPEKGSILQV